MKRSGNCASGDTAGASACNSAAPGQFRPKPWPTQASQGVSKGCVSHACMPWRLVMLTVPPAAGPLEATIHSMQTELATKAAESSDMQRRWLSMQTELVGLQVRFIVPVHLSCTRSPHMLCHSAFCRRHVLLLMPDRVRILHTGNERRAGRRSAAAARRRRDPGRARATPVRAVRRLDCVKPLSRLTTSQ